MKREEFLLQLERLLFDIPQAEREDAILFYQEYFADAGEENEERVIKELGSPQQVAKIIKADLDRDRKKEETKSSEQDQHFYLQQNIVERQSTRSDDLLKTILIAMIALFTSPIWMPLVLGFFGLAIGGVFTVFALALALLIVVAVFFILAFFLIGIGIAQIIAGTIAVGFAISGTGFVIFAVAMLGFLLSKWLLGKILPCFIKGMVGMVNRLFYRGRREFA